MKKSISKILSITIVIMTFFSSISIAITPVAVKSINLTSSNVTVQVGNSYSLKTTITPSNATNAKLTYLSSNKNIATVDKNGKIKGIKEGKTVVIVTSVSNKKAIAKCNVIVSQPTWKKQKVSLVTWDYPAEGATKESILARFKEFEEKYPNIKVEHKLVQPKSGSNDRVEFTTAMAGGNGPDLYQGVHYTVAKLWATQGFMYPLDEYLDNWEETKYLQPSAVKIATMNGKRYGLPYLMTPFALGYRVDNFKEAGLDTKKPPKTWAEYAKYAEKLTNEEKGKYGISLMGSGIADWWFQFYVWQAGGEITSVQKDGTVKLHITEKSAIDALQFYKDLKWKYNVTQKNTLMEFGDQVTDFCNGKAAMMIVTPEWVPWFTSLGLKQEDMEISVLPAGPSGMSTASMSGLFYSINPSISKEKRDAAWEYIKFMCNRENTIKMYKDLAEANVKYPSIPMYTDINIRDYMDAPLSWVKVLNESAKVAREEYPLVEDIRPYLVKAIQAVLVNKDADPKTELNKVAVDIEREVIKKFNSSLKK
jgi:multiple sugar transport system substrate-binding protein